MFERKIILLDQDGVLADLEASFLVIWTEKYPGRFYVPLKERKHFKIKEDYPECCHDDIDSIFNAEGFYRNLIPVEGALDAVREMERCDLDISICTSPLTSSPYCASEKFDWVKHFLGQSWLDKLVITRDKSLVRGRLLIDDKPEVHRTITPVWEHILFDQPYNREVVGQRRLCGWENWKPVILG